MTNDEQNPSLAEALDAEVSRFHRRTKMQFMRPLTLLISDFEFEYDMASFRRYQLAENDPTEGWVRWPFHHLVAGSWMTMTFIPGLSAPKLGPIHRLTAKDSSESEIAKAYCANAEISAGGVLASWGGEQKDWPVMRRVASEFGFALPPQLLDLNVHSKLRLDLCNATSGQARCPHLPEHAMATGVPCKPMPSYAVGDAVLQRRWDLVEQQVIADLFTIAILTARHSIAHRMTNAALEPSEEAIAGHFGLAFPESDFHRASVHRLRAARAKPWVSLVA